MQDAEELGVIFIGTESKGYSVKEFVPLNTRGNKWKYGVMVTTPERQFVFMCEQEQERKEWLWVLRGVLRRPMAPQDYTSKHLFTHSNHLSCAVVLLILCDLILVYDAVTLPVVRV